MSFFLLAFPALFSIVNPLGGAFIFLSATEHFHSTLRARLARWIAIYSFIIITASFYVGAYVLTFFGVSVPVLRVAGGIVITLAAWKILNAPDTKPGDEGRSTELPELVGLADRILVFYRGRLTSEISGIDATDHDVLHAINTGRTPDHDEEVLS